MRRFGLIRSLWRPLVLLFLLRLSTARSFQSFLTQTSKHNSQSFSERKYSRKNRFGYLPAAHTTSPVTDLFGDWTTSALPVSRNKRKGISSSIKKQTSRYQSRKEEWANRYTNVDSLRETFGGNRNKVWGDLDASTSRRLYKTLMPVALLELAKLGVKPEDLAPLAYQARVAAKLYARERCQVPARVAATLYDGLRQFQRYGKFQSSGMTYDQIWEKYHKAIIKNHEDQNDIDDLTEQICLKILERSCSSNKRVDRWFLRVDDGEREDLLQITKTLERDVRRLLEMKGHTTF